MKKNDCVYDFALVTPPGDTFSRARSAYDGVLSSFGTIEGP